MRQGSAATGGDTKIRCSYFRALLTALPPLPIQSADGQPRYRRPCSQSSYSSDNPGMGAEGAKRLDTGILAKDQIGSEDASSGHAQTARQYRRAPGRRAHQSNQPLESTTAVTSITPESSSVGVICHRLLLERCLLLFCGFYSLRPCYRIPTMLRHHACCFLHGMMGVRFAPNKVPDTKVILVDLKVDYLSL